MFEYKKKGFCHICELDVEFSSPKEWFRGHLTCANCKSIPRERAIMYAVKTYCPNWKEYSIHESSPSNRGASLRIRNECKNYIASQFFPRQKLGEVIKDFRNENLENQTFENNRFDLVISLDVMEHVNLAHMCFKEVSRTLKPGGMYIFTTPTYKEKVKTQRRSIYHKDGEVEHFFKPEYHKNPVDENGSLVTFHFGYDFPELIYTWSGLNCHVIRFQDHNLGIIGEFTEVYVCIKNS